MRNAASSLPSISWSDRLRPALRSLTCWIWTCAERSAQRRALLDLDDDRLRDIGLSRSEARAEAEKPFWWR
jgi:uncharacterized protein YjiS (DUF1127 family)